MSEIPNACPKIPNACPKMTNACPKMSEINRINRIPSNACLKMSALVTLVGIHFWGL